MPTAAVAANPNSSTLGTGSVAAPDLETQLEAYRQQLTLLGK